MIFALNSPCKSYENEQNPYFSDFECNFRLLGGVFHKCSKSKYHRFRQNNFFGTHFSCEKHPLHVFCLFFPLHANFFQKKLSSNSWGVKKAPCKNLYVFGENWQRNQFPKLTTLWLLFSLMLQLCHSALVIGHTGYCPMGTLVSCKVDPQQSASFNPLFTQGSSLSPSLPYCVQANHRSLSNCSPVI